MKWFLFLGAEDEKHLAVQAKNVASAKKRLDRYKKKKNITQQYPQTGNLEGYEHMVELWGLNLNHCAYISNDV